MGPRGKHLSTGDLFLQPLIESINVKHPLVRLVELICWSVVFMSKTGRLVKSPWLGVGLRYRQQMFAYPENKLLSAWVEDPYWKHFCGEQHFRHEPPVGPSSLTRWRQRVGDEGVECLLTETIEAARRGKVIKKQSFDKIIIDTTVIAKAVAYPTDSRLLRRGPQQLVKLAATLGSYQNYNSEVPCCLAIEVGYYANGNNYRRMRTTLRILRSRVGWVWCDIDRKLDRQDDATTAHAEAILAPLKRLLTQKPKDESKIISLHAPEIGCISKGKVHQPYEFGVKITVTMTHKEGLVVGIRSMPGNSYDRHTLPEAVEQVSILTDYLPKVVIVYKGYRGVDIADVAIWRSSQKRGATMAIRKAIYRRSAIEQAIVHMKNDGRLRRHWLEQSLGDALRAVLWGAGHNLHIILRALQLFFTFFLAGLWAGKSRNESCRQYPFAAFVV